MIDICDYDYAASDMPSAFALQMVTFTRQLRHAQVLCDDKGNALVFETVSNAWTERLARAATVEMGGSALLALYPMSGRQAKACVVCGTLSLYANLGLELRESRLSNGDPVGAIANKLGASVLFHGRLTDMDRHAVGGFARSIVAHKQSETGQIMKFCQLVMVSRSAEGHEMHPSIS
ncbi:DUF917 family protein [Rhizobium leguminosarum]|uniref:S-methyl thiohydantoin desulfurase domain-containing protein n=1 Tax=Rhizobium leguminosarum TaxID=384 RepID=UPI0028F45E03|nr:DUF917 family protein [Rhizobium leguminosarum]